MTINTTNHTKNAIELRKELNENGTHVEHIVINGQKVGILGYTSEADKQNAIKALQTALDASDGNIYEMMHKLTTIATLDENNVIPDEVVKVLGKEFIISYANKTAYTMSGEAYATCTDLPDMPKEAIKAVLMARIESAWM
jgi:hypothetical protein